MPGTSLREIAIQKATKQVKLVDALTNEAPILASMPMEESSHQLTNVFEEIESVTGPSLVDLDAPLTEVGTNSKLKETALSVAGGIIKCPEDRAKMMGGFEVYVAKNITGVLRKSGMEFEANIYTNVLRKFAAANGKLTDAGGTGSTNYSLVVVHWVPGEITGLYSPDGFGNGKFFDLLPLYNGGLGIDPTTKQLVYAARLKTYFGVQTANERYVSSIVNIDPKNSKVPTGEMLNEAIRNARGGDNTFILCHPAVKDAISEKIKLEKMVTSSGEREVNTVIERYNGIPFLTSYNLPEGIEEKVTVE